MGTFFLRRFEADFVDAQDDGSVFEVRTSRFWDRWHNFGRDWPRVSSQRDTSHLPNLIGMRSDDHSRFRSGRATGRNPASLDLDQAEAARAVDAQFGMVAKRRDVNPRFPGDVEDVFRSPSIGTVL